MNNFTSIDDPSTSVEDTYTMTYIVLSSLNVILHTVGILLLGTRYKGGHKTSQIVFLINMSFAEALVNTFKLVLILLYTFVIQDIKDPPHFILILYESLTIMMYTGVDYLYLLSLFYITSDRLACVLLGMRHQTVWNHHQSKMLVLATWIFNVLVSISICLFFYYCYVLQERSDEAFIALVNTYIPVVIQCLFITFGIISYFIMFQSYVTSRRTIHSFNQSGDRPQSLCHIFLTSQFFVSILIITSSLVLAIIPNVVYTLVLILGVPIDETLSLHVSIARNIGGMLSDSVDGLIYVLLEPTVRKLLFEKVLRIKNQIHLNAHNDLLLRNKKLEIS